MLPEETPPTTIPPAVGTDSDVTPNSTSNQQISAALSNPEDQLVANSSPRSSDVSSNQTSEQML